MRSGRWLISILIVCGAILAAVPAFGRGKNAAAEEVRAAINEIKEDKLADVLNLPSDDTGGFMELYTQWEEVRWSYKERRAALLAELQAGLTGDLDRSRSVKAILDDIDTTDAEARASEEDLREEFRTLLNDEQYGKLLLFEFNFNKNLRRLIQQQNLMNVYIEPRGPINMDGSSAASEDEAVPQPTPVKEKP